MYSLKVVGWCRSRPQKPGFPIFPALRSGTRRHTPGAEAPSLLYRENAKAKALA
jgi:hypothetical protein